MALDARLARPLGRAFVLSALALGLLLALAVWALRPGLDGPFLFDDEPNLSQMGAYGGVRDWASARAYLSTGFAGPSGRPLALASFLIDDHTWPTEPRPFKLTNLKLHLLNFLLLVWLGFKLARFYGLEERRAVALALINGGIWLLHPLLVSTTLYVVQRMALLSTLFVFAGMLAYLHGRMRWPQQPRAALAWMGGGLVLGTTLATLSKENGALLPLLLLVIESCRPPNTPRLPRLFSAIFLWLPTAAVVAYLLSQWNPSPDAWPHRPFNQIERLLTQPRVLWDYLAWWFLPRIEEAGLYQDAWVISRGLTDPPQTLPALLGVLTLAAGGLLLRRRAPWLAVAILFFFTGHLLESTLLGLELYFEHRNYLPTALLALPLAHLAVQAWPRYPRAVAVGALALGATLAFLTHQRATLWGDPVRLEAYWAAAAPDSPRAANALAILWYLSAQRPDQARAVLTQALARNPHHGLLWLSYLALLINERSAQASDFERAAQGMRAARFDAQTVLALRQITERLLRDEMPAKYRRHMRVLIERLTREARFRDEATLQRIAPYLLAQLILKEGDAARAETLYFDALRRNCHVEAGMQMTAEMANAGHPEPAMRLLAQAEYILRQQPDHSLKFERAFYEREIARIRAILQQELDRKRSAGGNPLTAS